MDGQTHTKHLKESQQTWWRSSRRWSASALDEVRPAFAATSRFATVSNSSRTTGLKISGDAMRALFCTGSDIAGWSSDSGATDARGEPALRFFLLDLFAAFTAPFALLAASLSTAIDSASGPSRNEKSASVSIQPHGARFKEKRRLEHAQRRSNNATRPLPSRSPGPPSMACTSRHETAASLGPVHSWSDSYKSSLHCA